ncbi:MAG: hypothetical protein AAFU84_14695, partial [Cyanobacteria bacterium J06633_23]
LFGDPRAKRIYQGNHDAFVRAGVDPIAVSEIQQIVSKLRDRNMGILITDHNVRETLRIIDRAYIMSDGRILAYGSAEDLASNPLVREHYLGDDFKL